MLGSTLLPGACSWGARMEGCKEEAACSWGARMEGCKEEAASSPRQQLQQLQQLCCSSERRREQLMQHVHGWLLCVLQWWVSARRGVLPTQVELRKEEAGIVQRNVCH